MNMKKLIEKNLKKLEKFTSLKAVFKEKSEPLITKMIDYLWRRKRNRK